VFAQMEDRPMFTVRTHTAPGLLLAAGLLLIPGCLERKETIRVDQDGSVRIRVEVDGEPGDFASGDSLPDKYTGWKTQDELRTKDDGKEEQHRIATRRFSAGQPLPDSYADPDGPRYGIALMFPTTLEIERRPDGTYYHFKRVYEARAQARYEVYRELFKDIFEEMDQLAGKDPAELTDEQRTRLVEILRLLEALKRAEYVAAGAEALADVWPQHYGLLLRQALMDHFQRADSAELADLLGQPNTPERNDAINAFGDELIASARDVLHEELVKLRVPRDQIELFFAAHDEEEARRAVTEDLEDETWEVRVEMPGEIVAHNGTDRDETGVIWSFPGKALYDRDHVLMVTSRVTRGAGRPTRERDVPDDSD
jgi:hypothetical protein